MRWSVLNENSYFNVLGSFLSSKLHCGSYTVTVSKATTKNIRALIHYEVSFL